MVFLNFRYTVTDYEKWLPFFYEFETTRRAYGATGVKQVYRDVDDPNTITLVMEWDNEENARKFMNDPALREQMVKAGLVGTPAVRAVLSRAMV